MYSSQNTGLQVKIRDCQNPRLQNSEQTDFDVRIYNLDTNDQETLYVRYCNRF